MKKLKLINLAAFLGLLVVGVFVYNALNRPNQVSVINSSPACQNNLKSLSLSTQCGDKSFRKLNFECNYPAASALSTQLDQNGCYTMDYLYGLANQTCGNCIPPVAAIPQLLFAPVSLNTSRSAVFTTSLIVDTAGQAANGVGAKLTFDPSYLQVLSITPGTLFASYPTSTYDNVGGHITVSGISASLTDTFTGKDTFAILKFRAIKLGTTSITYDYVEGSTTDSNIAVTTGNGDILGKVTPLSITIARR